MALLLLAPLGLITFVGHLFGWRRWFSFDDEKRRIRGPLGFSLPYEKIKAIHITEANGQLSLCAQRGRFNTVYLPSKLHSKEKGRLLDELGKRFSSEMIRYRKRSVLRVTTLRVLAPLLLYVVVVTFMYYRFPLIRLAPQEKVWEKGQNLWGEQTYTLNGISFSLPGRFQIARQKRDRILLKDELSKMRVWAWMSVDTTSSAVLKFFSYYVMDVKDMYDIQKEFYYARFEVVPLVMKHTALDRLTKEGIHEINAIFDIQQDGLNGFLVRGTRNRIDIADMMLVNKKKPFRINFYIESLEPIDDATLGAIIKSVRSVEQ